MQIQKSLSLMLEKRLNASKGFFPCVPIPKQLFQIHRHGDEGNKTGMAEQLSANSPYSSTYLFQMKYETRGVRLLLANTNLLLAITYYQIRCSTCPFQ